MKNKNLSTWGHFTVVEYMGELGWEGCADEEILLCSCGLSPPTPGSPRSTSPAKHPPPPAEKPKPPALPPTQTHTTQKALHASSPAAALGKVVACLPASQAPTERVFSSADWSCANRERLSFSMLATKVFIRVNYMKLCHA